MTNPELAATAEAAAARLLDALVEGDRSRARFAFTDEAVRHDWHYIPRERPGVCLADIGTAEQKLALDLLATGFSIGAYAAACAVMSLEDPLDIIEDRAGPRRGRARRWGRHRAEYHVAIFGEPGEPAWGWRFEGHHVSVTMTIADGHVVTVPHFLGANPAEVGALRILPAEEDLAFALLDAMTAAERRGAIVADSAPDDILTTNDAVADGAEFADGGVVLRELGPEAQRLAAALADLYLAREPATRPVEVGALRFVFAGEPRHRAPHYYRLVGADLLVEYDNTQNDANHIHTVVRHPRLDFGRDLLRGHRAEHHS